MVKSKVILRNFSNVAASKTALLDCPIGPRYHGIWLEHGYASGTNTVAAAATNVAEIRVKVNGTVERVVSGTQLRDLLLLYGTAYDSLGVPNTAPGVSFFIPFAEPWRELREEGDSLAWATSTWSTLQVEVDLGAASTPTLVASAVIDALPGDDQQGIIKWIRSSVAASGTSFDIPTIDRKDWMSKIHLYPDSGGSNATSKVTVRLNSQILHEHTFSANKAVLTNHNFTPAASGRTASVTDIVFDHDDFIGSMLGLDGSRDFSLTVEAASTMSGTITYILQKLGLPETMRGK